MITRAEVVRLALKVVLIALGVWFSRELIANSYPGTGVVLISVVAYYVGVSDGWHWATRAADNAKG
jgi:hypothetical protein